jgi:putative transposase
MWAARIIGDHRCPHIVTTVREPSAPLAPDHIQRQFAAEKPNTRWTADITYVPTWSGVLYRAVVLDVCSRRIVGWAMADQVRTELRLSALEVVLWNRRLDPGVNHHSDHGCQYTSTAFGSRCQEAQVVPSLGSRGDRYDNAITGSIFATLECERLDRSPFRTYAQARTAIFDYIEAFYNTIRPYSALGYMSLAAFERQFKQESAA